LIGFLFRGADLHPPYNEIACSEFQDFREALRKVVIPDNAVNLT